MNEQAKQRVEEVGMKKKRQSKRGKLESVG